MDLNEKFRQMWERSGNGNGKVKRRGPMGCEDYFKGCEDYEKEDVGEDDEEEKPSSGIFRVSKASGGKDRHSKVYTAKGLRDRRVRLSVSTAIQFYDLQDRLGYDQPSKAVEWLIKAATDAIAELPPLNGTLPNSSSPLHDSFFESGRDEGSEEWVLVGKGGDEHDPDPDLNIHRHLSEITRSTCSSTSETSKGSVLSLSRSEIRIKARERARERTKEKVEISTVTPVSIAQHGLNPNSHGDGSKKTEMTGGSVPFASSAMDYLNSGVFNPDLIPKNQNHNQSLPLMSLAPFNPPFMDHHHELQQFSFFQDRIIPVASSNDYNLDFSMPSFSAGHDRGTLQSNSSLLSRNQKFSSPISTDDGSSMPFFIPIAGAGENQHPGGFDGRLQLSYGRHLELKGKGKC